MIEEELSSEKELDASQDDSNKKVENNIDDISQTEENYSYENVVGHVSPYTRGVNCGFYKNDSLKTFHYYFQSLKPFLIFF